MGRGGTAPEALLARGDLLQAAEAFAREGRYLEAADVYEKLCLDADAARAALAGNDPIRAHAIWIRARDWTEAARIRSNVLASEGADLDARSRAFARDLLATGRAADAAALLEAVGDLDEASAAYRSAGALQAAARLEAFLGRFRSAAELLRAFVDDAPDGHDGAAVAAHAEARLSLGRVLIRAGRPGDAIIALQKLLDLISETEAVHGTEATAAWLRGALGLLVRAFDVLGHPAAAEASWRRLVPLLDDPPADYQTWLLASEDARSETGDDGEARVVGGRYRLAGLLGAGSAGQVYRAHDQASGREVALKLVAGGGAEGGGMERFFREARIAASLDHPGLVRIIEAAPDRGYLAMEYLSGGTLTDRLRGGRRLSLGAVREIGLALADCLGAVHRRGVLHRDVKPENILFDAAGRPRLADLGAAHLISFKQTATGYLLGTLAYMAPEQLAGDTLTATTDLWGLSVTLYRALTGRLPFPGPDVAEQHREGAPAPSRLLTAMDRDVGAHLDAYFARAFSLDPSERFEDATRLIDALTAWPAGEARGVGAIAESLESDAPSTRREDRAGAPLFGSDRYGVKARVGARVSLAQDAVLHRPVAIERVPMDGGAVWLERVAAIARAGNPHLQAVLDVDLEEDFVVWSWIEGTPLHETQGPETPRSVEAALRIGADVAGALVDHPGVFDPENVRVADGRATVILAGSETLRSGSRPSDDARPVVGRVIGWVCDGVDPGETPEPLEAVADARGSAAPASPAALARWLMGQKA